MSTLTASRALAPIGTAGKLFAFGKPDDAVAAVRDGADLGLEPGADPRGAAGLAGPWAAAHRGICPRVRGLRSTWPRRRSPGRTRVDSRSSRSRAISEDLSW